MKLRISMYYLLCYLGLGAFMPFMSLFLQERGFDGIEIGAILAVGSLTGIVAQPVFGIINDTARDYRTLLKVSSIVSSIVVFGFYFSHSIVAFIITTIVFTFVQAPASPIMDAIAVEKGPAYGLSYGQVRLWGAFGFAFITVVAGYVFNSIGFQYSFVASAVFSIMIFLLIFSFPKLERSKRPPIFGREMLGAVFSNWQFGLFIAISWLIAAIVTMNFSYLPIYFKKMNYPMELIGWNFTIAAVVEIPLFWLSSLLIRRFGLFPMLAIGSCSYAVKYVIMGFAPPVGVLLGLQALDGMAFAFFQCAAVEIVNLMSPKHAKATGQTVFAAAGGIAGILGNVVGGLVVDHQGPQFLFWLMGAIGFLAALLYAFFPRKGQYHINSGVRRDEYASMTS